MILWSIPSYLPQRSVSAGSRASSPATFCVSSLPGRSQIDDPPARRARGLQGRGNGLRLHHHPRSAAVGGVVADVVPVHGKVPDVDQADRHEPAGNSPRQDRALQKTLEKTGKRVRIVIVT